MVVITGSDILCQIGWYYITDESGIKYWIYLTQEFTISTLNAPSGFLNFTISTNDVFASENESTGDERLFDNSSGFPNTNSPGSFRVKRDISSIQFQSGSVLPMIEKINNEFDRIIASNSTTSKATSTAPGKSMSAFYNKMYYVEVIRVNDGNKAYPLLAYYTIWKAGNTQSKRLYKYI
jgi:hypothetical protein